jgi:hypothetical protein
MDCRNESSNDNSVVVITALVAVIHRRASGKSTLAQGASWVKPSMLIHGLPQQVRQ